MEEIRTFTINGKEIKAIVISEIEDWKNDIVFTIYHNNSIKQIIESRGEIIRYTSLMPECYCIDADRQLGIIPFYEIAPSFKD